MFKPVQDGSAQGYNGERKEHTVISEDRHKKSEQIRPKADAEIKEQEKGRRGLRKTRTRDQRQGHRLSGRLEIAETYAEKHSRQKKGHAVLGHRQQHHGQRHDDKSGIEYDIFTVVVQNMAAEGSCSQRCCRIDKEKDAGDIGKPPLLRKRSKKGLYAAVAEAGHQRHQRKPDHARIDIAVQIRHGAVLLQHGGKTAKSKKDNQTDYARSQGRPYDGLIARPADKGNAKKRPCGQSKRRTHGEQTDSQTMILSGNHIGHYRAGSGTRYAYGNACQEALSKKQGKRQGKKNAAMPAT